jgi:hypothetical protein
VIFLQYIPQWMEFIRGFSPARGLRGLVRRLQHDFRGSERRSGQLGNKHLIMQCQAIIDLPSSSIQLRKCEMLQQTK